MPSENFFAALPGFTDFARLDDPGLYVPAPADWSIVITDIQGSTKAIQEGRYKDVNTLGAASIASVLNELKGHSVPFVFGGDGATFLIPPEFLPAVRSTLLQLRRLAREQFDMGLRIGVISASEVLAAGQVLEVAKFQLAPGRDLALFRGGGLSWAEKRIKSQQDTYCLNDNAAPELSKMTGLSCRWQPLPSHNGSMLSILVSPRTPKHSHIYGDIIRAFTSFFPSGLEAANPVRMNGAKYKSLREMVRSERGYTASRWSLAYVKRVLEMLLCLWSFVWKLPAPFDVAAYTDSIPAHSDYRKLDDTLRIVLDCNPQQARQIRAHLESLYARGLIFYGIHESSHALMTCFVEHLGEGGHLHFIDGSNGGYAAAAQQLKAQMAMAAAAA